MDPFLEILFTVVCLRLTFGRFGRSVVFVDVFGALLVFAGVRLFCWRFAYAFDLRGFSFCTRFAAKGQTC